MMKAGTETGSLTNHLYSRVKRLEPKVGMGATELRWTDRKAVTIVKVTPTQVHVQYDIATRTDKNGMSENQTYSYESDPSSPVEIFRLTKKGYRSKSGSGLLIGERDEYYDFSF